jgi:hypothetical protein
MDADLENIKQLINDITVTREKEPAKLGQIEGLKMTFTGSLMKQQMEFTRVSAISGDKAYTMTHNCKKGECQHTAIFNDMTKSIQPTSQPG